MPNSYWKNLRHVFSGGKKYSTAAARSAFPLRQCPACGLYSRNDPAKCSQCTDVEFLLRSPFVVHDLNEDFAASRVQAAALLNRIVAECQQKNEAFVDETFPQNAATAMSTQDVEWCRLFNDHQQKIFGDVVTSSMTIIRECFEKSSFLLHALLLVSHASCRPHILQNIFMTSEAAVCPEGAYVLRLCSNGRWTTVILDDSVPFVHSRVETSDGDLWVSLIEKAAAKLCDSYEALVVDGGDVCEWMEMLTGAPTESTRLVDYLNSANNRDYLWKILLDAYKNGFLMMTASGDIPADETTKSLEKDTEGDPFVRSKQNYAIANVFQEGTVRKLSLRQSLLDKDQLPMFDITFGDFIQYFCVMHVCRVRPDWTEVRVEGTLPSQCPLNDEDVDIPIRRLTIAEKTSLDITFYQNVLNDKPADRTGRLLTDLFIVIFTERSGHDIENRVNFEDIVCQSPRCTQASVSLHCQLNPGSYLIACLSINSFLYDYGDIKFVMAVRSPQPLLPMRKLQFTRCALTDALIRLTMFKGAPALPSILSPGVNAFAYANPIWHGRILVVENTVRDKFAVVNFFCPLRDKYVVATRSSMPTKDYIPPVCRRIVAILTEEEWDRLGLFSSSAGFVVATTVANKDPSDDESTPKFGDRVKGLHVARPMWLT